MKTAAVGFPWQLIMFVLGLLALVAAIVIGYVQINQAQQIQSSNENYSATQISLLETDVSYRARINEGSTPLATSAENATLEAGLATVEAQIGQVEMTATQSVRLTLTAIAATPIYSVSNEDFEESMIAATIESNSLLCITTGPIYIKTSKSSMQFSGDGRGSIICWIGSQFAQASGLNGYASIKNVEISQGDPLVMANQLVLQWATEMTTRFDGCGSSYGPCDAADMAIVLPDGSILRP